MSVYARVNLKQQWSKGPYEPVLVSAISPHISTDASAPNPDFTKTDVVFGPNALGNAHAAGVQDEHIQTVTFAIPYAAIEKLFVAANATGQTLDLTPAGVTRITRGYDAQKETFKGRLADYCADIPVPA